MNNAQHKILIVNQHGDNRGDEAAMRAMVHAFQERLHNPRFTILHQFRDRDLKPELNAETEWGSIVISPWQAIQLTLAALAHRLGFDIAPHISPLPRNMLRAYTEASLVVSAPGGPYFGDIYAKHEIVHWYYVWLAVVLKKRLFLYAPSVGPFQNAFLNPVRKWLFRKFDAICVRENISADYLHKLIPGIEATVTADSALQRKTDAQKAPGEHQGKYVITVSAREHQFADITSNQERADLQDHYLSILESAVLHIKDRLNVKFLFIPQLYGKRHNDVDFLRKFAARLPEDTDYEIVSSDIDAEAQQDIFASAHLCIASRYHPQIFAAAAGVPGICIAYEHKMSGFMRRLHLERFAFSINNLDREKVLSALDEAIENRDALSAHMTNEVSTLKALSRTTTDMAVALLREEKPQFESAPTDLKAAALN